MPNLQAGTRENFMIKRNFFFVSFQNLCLRSSLNMDVYELKQIEPFEQFDNFIKNIKK